MYNFEPDQPTPPHLDPTGSSALEKPAEGQDAQNVLNAWWYHRAHGHSIPTKVLAVVMDGWLNEGRIVVLQNEGNGVLRTQLCDMLAPPHHIPHFRKEEDMW